MSERVRKSERARERERERARESKRERKGKKIEIDVNNRIIDLVAHV